MKQTKAQLLQHMQHQEQADRAAARQRWESMTEAEQQAWRVRQAHMGKKMQSSVD